MLSTGWIVKAITAQPKQHTTVFLHVPTVTHYSTSPRASTTARHCHLSSSTALQAHACAWELGSVNVCSCTESFLLKVVWTSLGGCLIYMLWQLGVRSNMTDAVPLQVMILVFDSCERAVDVTGFGSPVLQLKQILHAATCKTTTALVCILGIMHYVLMVLATWWVEAAKASDMQMTSLRQKCDNMHKLHVSEHVRKSWWA